MHDIEVGSQMDVNTWGAFAGSNDKAVVDGDFAMCEAKLQNVLKALRGAGINVVGNPSAYGRPGASNYVFAFLGRCLAKDLATPPP